MVFRFGSVLTAVLILALLALPAAADIACGGEGKSVPDSHVNDDYCDCELEGTDEPRTGACANQPFVCANKPASALTIPASRVNDGVCDCCDGTDEDSAHISCPNTCMETAAKARAALEAELKSIEEGSAIRAQRAQDGQAAKAKRLLDVSEADGKLAALVASKADLEATKAKEEALEKEEAEVTRMRVEQDDLPTALSLASFSVPELSKMIVDVVLGTKDSAATEKTTTLITGKSTAELAARRRWFRAQLHRRCRRCRRRAGECEVDDVDALSIAIEEKEAAPLPAIPPDGDGLTVPHASINAPLFEGCSVFLHKSEAADSEASPPFAVGDHDLGVWDGSYIAIRTSARCKATLLGDDGNEMMNDQRSDQDGNQIMALHVPPCTTQPCKYPKVLRVAAVPIGCVSWRNRGACSPDGEAEPHNDKPCGESIASGMSGFCECDGGVQAGRSTCESRTAFTCEAKCAEIVPMTAAQKEEAQQVAKAEAERTRTEAIAKRAELEAAMAERRTRLTTALCLASRGEAELGALLIAAALETPAAKGLLVPTAVAAAAAREQPAIVDAEAAKAALALLATDHKRAEADTARAELTKVEEEVTRVQRSKDDAQKLQKLEADFGTDQEFFYLHGKETTKRLGSPNSYDYKVKLFDDVKQD